MTDTMNNQLSDMESVNKIIVMMESISLFNGIANVQLKVIASHMNIVQLEPNDLLFLEGRKSDSMCFVVSGSLDVFKQAENNKRVKVSTLSRGSSIGEMALLDTFPRSATVIAGKACTLLTISREDFDYILEHHPRAGICFLKGISRMLSLHLRQTSGHLADVIP